ncbi:AprI/Inh family metalloprotease inhibitor [Acuticoccus sp. I52.16.1]|uniref:AprI/Inh family metalloprotease inhibitor n=1 Tax=Acuticoccus sp. I52.16.1 TaxID=2928472 RepID=UPI001FD11515|nr:AprI/Inh family metalloprotease inhibitor [Acuticoccus sp. I52.16.1]UOM35962.1 AprI/Inh family metalloprotease inhibitor [Acuticoccus sp. I52.16.1]
MIEYRSMSRTSTSGACAPRTLGLAMVGILTVALGGCMTQRTQTVASVQPAPSRPVSQAPLAPPPITQQPQEPQVPEAPIAGQPLPDGSMPGAPGTDVAAASPAPSGVNVGRTDLLGGWSIASGGDNCQLFMSLTTWTGGYRASTRGCSAPSLAGIAAWDLNGSQVTLKGGDGSSTVATLRATSAQSFSGSTADGSGITVSR